MTDLKEIFKEALELDNSVNISELVYNTIEQWDSIGHMTLVAEIEDAYDIMLETDDVLDLSSFNKAIEILKKYDVQL